MNQCQTSLRDLGWGKTCSSPASINYHKRGVKTYEPVSDLGWGKTCPSPTFEIGAQVHVRLCANASTIMY